MRLKQNTAAVLSEKRIKESHKAIITGILESDEVDDFLTGTQQKMLHNVLGKIDDYRTLVESRKQNGKNGKNGSKTKPYGIGTIPFGSTRSKKEKSNLRQRPIKVMLCERKKIWIEVLFIRETMNSEVAFFTENRRNRIWTFKTTESQSSFHLHEKEDNRAPLINNSRRRGYSMMRQGGFASA